MVLYKFKQTDGFLETIHLVKPFGSFVRTNHMPNLMVHMA